MDGAYKRLSCDSCSEACAHKRCAQCDKEFKPGRDKNYFCSAACRNAERSRALCACKACGAEFKPKSVSRITYCSRECAFTDKTRQALERASLPKPPKPERSPVARVCTECANVFAEVVARARCGAACDRKHAIRSVRNAAIARHKQDARVIRCEECECEFCPVYGSGGARLCGPCSESRARASHKVARLMRDMRTRTSQVERVDPYLVFERDGWMCKACGVPTPKAKRGTNEMDSPELDHVYPLSKGGAHTYANTQCLCRRCNGLKSDRVPCVGSDEIVSPASI